MFSYQKCLIKQCKGSLNVGLKKLILSDFLELVQVYALL